ncbi:hypothetical protein DWZ96_19450 [Clostridium sp. AF36-18BH]|nr:hypothetical protein DWZ96_19450 [Clostridium sp. AF36-18BH]
MINNETGDELDPYTLSKTQKESAYTKGTIYICKCCYPEKQLKYHFSVDLRLIPCHPEFTRQHDEACRKNEDYQKRIAYANPLQQEEDGKLVARVYENLFERPNRLVAETGDEHKKRRDTGHTEQQRMRLSALVKKINLEVSYRQACRFTLKEGDTDETKIKLKLEEKFSKEVYGQAKDVRISNRGGTVAGCSLDKNGVQFFYNRLTSIKIVFYSIDEKKSNYEERTSISYQELVNIKTNNDKNKIRSYFSVKINGYYVKITYDALRIAIHQYESTYNNRILDLENDIIIGAGYQYEKKYKDKNDNIRKEGEIDRLTLLLVNKYGIFCESSYEVKCFDVIMDYIMNGKLYQEVKFYKPYSFTKNAYGDAEWLEDGIITVKGCKKAGIVEVFGMMGNEEYQEKTRLKEQYARENEDKFVFLTWKPQTESEEVLLNRLVRCIADIRKSAYA